MYRDKLNQLIVLKFGGSVLRDDDDLARIGHEVYRWVRQGFKVVAVVSAFEGETDRLYAEAKAASSAPLADAAALLVSTGELRSAARLAIALDRSGIAVTVLDSAAIDLVTDTSALDAAPESVGVPRIHAALRRHDVLVIPGFTGRDRFGRVTLLGRGGSDLTALSLAKYLGARCRLIKDVHGLYEWDPRLPGNPGLFATLPWSKALRLDGSIIQHKAVAAAADDCQSFEVASLHDADCTCVGDLPAEFRQRSEDESLRPLRVGVVGAGTVGGGVLQHLLRSPKHFSIETVLVRDRSRYPEWSPEVISDDPHDFISRDLDVVVDCSGDLLFGREVGEMTLQTGCHFVTANKFLVAQFGRQLEQAADSGGGEFKYSAAVGGGAPFVERLRDIASTGDIVELTGLLNGTTNFVLDRVAAGSSFQDAIAAAQIAGFAESNVDNDLSGLDAACKLVVLAREITQTWLPVAAVARKPVDASVVSRTPVAAVNGYRLRHTVRARFVGSQPRLSAQLTPVKENGVFGKCVAEWNVLVVRKADGSREILRGRGAGRWPTAESVLADLFDLARHRTDELKRSLPLPALDPLRRQVAGQPST